MTQLKQLESAHKQFANQRMSPWSLFLMAWLILSSIPFFFFPLSSSKNLYEIARVF